MRIDDNILYQVDENININIDQDIDDIELLIRDIEITENTLRRNKRIALKNTIIDEIEDVDIEIDIPEEYYLNKDRRIMKYAECNIQYIFYMISMNIVNTILHLIKVIINNINEPHISQFYP